MYRPFRAIFSLYRRLLLYRGGYLMCLGSGQERQAEELLTKSIKLNPKLVEAFRQSPLEF